MASCILVINASSRAQEVTRQRYITLTYAPNQAYIESAIETIEAVNSISPATNVEYRAGQAVTLKPGFEAKAGAIFTGHIEPVSDSQLQLTAFPNPYDQSTTVSFELPESGLVNLNMVDIQGQVVSQLLTNGQLTAGQHKMEWNGSKLPAGVYMLTLQIKQQKVTSRIIKK